jgi:hypothetical protein
MFQLEDTSLLIILLVLVFGLVIYYLYFNKNVSSEGFENTNSMNSFDITNKMNTYRSSTDPYDNNFYSNTNGYINPMDRGQYVGLVEKKK